MADTRDLESSETVSADAGIDTDETMEGPAKPDAAVPDDARAPDVWRTMAEFPPRPQARYEVRAKLSQGGLGRIWRAYDRWLGREVAVKELHRPESATAARFRREATLTGRLQHPSIVPLHDAGVWSSGEPFYAMKLVEGRPLSQAIRDARGFRDRVGLLANVRAVADAISYAHEHRVIHRDLKPDNIMVGDHGETIVVDWGLAKVLGDPDIEMPGEQSFAVAAGLTSTGAVLGTPAYMAPEQARGQAVDERADVYALGAVLYAVLAGAPPYRGTHSTSVVEAVLEGPPAPLRALVPDSPPDLLAIVDRAMARDPADRYPSATELAADLRRFETGQLVSAHSYGVGLLVRRWLRRHRAAVAVAALATLVLVVLGTVAVARIVDERAAAQRHAREARARESEVTLLQAESALDGDPTAAVAWLKRVAITDDNVEDVRAIADAAVQRGVARHVLAGRPYLFDVAFSPDGARVAATWVDGTVLVRDVRTGAERRLAGDGGALLALAFSPAGDELAAVAENGAVFVWPADGGAHSTVGRHDSMGRAIAFSADGAWLASSAHEPRVLVWRRDGTSRDVVAGDVNVAAIAFAPRSDELAIADQRGGLTIYRPGRDALQRLGEHAGGIHAIAFSPDGRQLASAGVAGEVLVWHLEAGAQVTLTGHDGIVLSVMFSPDGRWLGTVGEDGTVRLWDTATWQPRVLTGHREAARALAFTRDGTAVISTGAGGSAIRWDLRSGEPLPLRGHRGGVRAVAVSREGAIATLETEGELRLWHLPSAASELAYVHGGPARGLALGPDGQLAAIAGVDGVVGLVDLRDGSARHLRGHVGEVTDVAFSRDGDTLLSVGGDGTLRAWRVADGSGRVLYQHSGALLWLSPAPNGDLVGLKAMADEVVVVSTSAGVVRDFRDGDNLSSAVQFAPDGRFAVGRSTGEIELWDPASPGAPVRVLVGHAAEVKRVAFSPDASVVVSCDRAGQARVWRGGDRDSRVVLSSCQESADIAFSADGTRFAIASTDHSIHIVPAAGGQPRIAVGHRDRVWRVRFSTNDSFLVSSSSDRTVRTWDLDGTPRRVLIGHSGKVVRVVVAPEAEWVVSLGRDGEMRRWHEPFEQRVPRDRAVLEAWLDDMTTAVVVPGGGVHSAPPQPGDRQRP